jgi:hypothetical protein
MSSPTEPPSQPRHDNRDPIDVIVHDTDPTTRSKAHRALGLRAKARSDLQMAEFHLREAHELDPHDEVTAEELRQIAPSTPRPPSPSLIGRFIGAVRRRTTGI